MSNLDRFPGWEFIKKNMNNKTPAEFPIYGDEAGPECQITVNQNGLLVLRIPIEDECDLGEFTERLLVLEQALVAGQRWLTLYTEEVSLSEDFFSFVCRIIDEIQIEKRSPLEAIEHVQRSWSELLSRHGRMSVEQEIGLVGELWFLLEVSKTIGIRKAVLAWKGAHLEEHDFGFEQIDVEVKTTTSEKREHWISSLTQMVPSEGRKLTVLSLQLTGATVNQQNAISLRTEIRLVRESLGEAGSKAKEYFEDCLVQARWREECADLYKRKFTIRSAPLVIVVDQKFPALTPSVLNTAPLLSEEKRIIDLRYKISVDGLGKELPLIDGGYEWGWL